MTTLRLCLSIASIFAGSSLGAAEPTSAATVAAAESCAASPHINGPSVFGVRPGNPFLYSIPATGTRPVSFEADGLPAGLTLDTATGHITGRIDKAGDYPVVLRVRNAQGIATKKFTIKCGEQICLTPPMGWNSWNCWAESVSQEKVIRSARAMVSSGLVEHGWTFINIDDTWQGQRSGAGTPIKSNEKFPDMKQLCDEVHAMGLKMGIYSTPWVTSYAGFNGGSAADESGAWTRPEKIYTGYHFGAVSFASIDAKQWAEWGFDYLKYDWFPNDVPHAAEMAAALRASGRDIVFSLSNSADPALAAEWAKLANCWRTTSDIGDEWAYKLPKNGNSWRWSVSEIGFSQDRWAPFAGPGHWIDPDMLVVGRVGWGPSLHPTHLTRDEQFSHITMWCMLSAPLLIGCDLEHLDATTYEVLTNDEALAVDQDALGKQAVRVATVGALDVYLKPLEDGTTALAFFNRSSAPEDFLFNKLPSIGLGGMHHVRDLWKHTDLADCNNELSGTVPGHGVLLLKLAKAPESPSQGN
jgi:alpha-galactosidase